MFEQTDFQTDNKNEISYKLPSMFRLVFVGMIVITPAVTPGMAMAFSAIALPQMKLNLDEGSWYASIVAVACPFGNLFTGSVIDKCGRRTALIASVIPSIIGWLLLGKIEASLTQLYIGRLLTGFALGAASLPSMVYAAECITINNHYLRGSLNTWTTLALSSGVLLTYGFGVILPYNEVALAAACFSIMSFFLILFFIPESPSWLYRKGRTGDAEVAQRRLGIKQPILWNKNIEAEPVTLITESDYILGNLLHYIKKIKRKEVYKPLLITIAFLFFTQFSGVYCLLSYMIDIVGRNSSADPYVLSVVSGLLQLLGVLSLTFLLPFCGVKILSVVSTLGTAIGFALLGFSEILSEENTESFFSSIHTFSVWCIVVTASLGLTVIPYAILGEMFPMGAKGYASLSLIASSTFNFIILKIYPFLHTQLGGLIFFLFSLISICDTVFVVLFLPETVGKTMDEIKNEFKNSR